MKPLLAACVGLMMLLAGSAFAEDGSDADGSYDDLPATSSDVPQSGHTAADLQREIDEGNRAEQAKRDAADSAQRMTPRERYRPLPGQHGEPHCGDNWCDAR